MNALPRLVVLISGTGSNLQALIDAETIQALHGELVAVVSNRSDALGLMRAQRANIPTHIVPFAPFKALNEPRRAYDRQLATVVNHYQPDLVILAGFMRILTDVFLNAVDCDVVNLHPALPGAYNGLNAMERAWQDHLDRGLETTGVMVHKVIEAVDMGPVMATRELDMNSFSDFQAFKHAMHSLEHELLVRVIGDWCLALNK